MGIGQTSSHPSRQPPAISRVGWYIPLIVVSGLALLAFIFLARQIAGAPLDINSIMEVPGDFPP